MSGVTQADIALAAEQAGKHYQTQFYYEMDLREFVSRIRQAAYGAGVAAERERVDSVIANYYPASRWTDELKIAIGETVRNEIRAAIAAATEGGA